MNRFLLLLLLIFVLLAGMAWAEPPILLSHTLTNYTKGTDSITLEFMLYLENLGDAPLYNLKLSYVPLMLITTEEVVLSIENLKAHETVDVPFSLTTPMLLREDVVSEQPLFWAGEYLDSNSKVIEFPAESRSSKRDTL